MKFTMRFLSPVLAAAGLVVALALPVAAGFPGKNGRIAFILGPDVYTMNPDGSDVKQLTNLGPDSFAFWESWSPDGKPIISFAGLRAALMEKKKSMSISQLLLITLLLPDVITTSICDPLKRVTQKISSSLPVLVRNSLPDGFEHKQEATSKSRRHV